MYSTKQNDNFWVGLMIGATIPVIGFFLVELIFGFLEDAGMMDEVSLSSAEKRQRTMALVALCFNLVPLQILRLKRYDALLRGLMVATFIYAGAWVFIFWRGFNF